MIDAPSASLTFTLQWHPSVSQPLMPQPKSIQSPTHPPSPTNSFKDQRHLTSIVARCCCPAPVCEPCFYLCAPAQAQDCLNPPGAKRLILWSWIRKRLMDSTSCRLRGLNTFRPSRVCTAVHLCFGKINLLKLVWKMENFSPSESSFVFPLSLHPRLQVPH